MIDSVKKPGKGRNQKDYYCLCEYPEENDITGTCRFCTKPLNFKREPKKGCYNFNSNKNNQIF